MTAEQLIKILSSMPADCRIRVFVPSIGDLEIAGVSTMGQIATVRPPEPQEPVK